MSERTDYVLLTFIGGPAHGKPVLDRGPKVVAFIESAPGYVSDPPSPMRGTSPIERIEVDRVIVLPHPNDGRHEHHCAGDLWHVCRGSRAPRAGGRRGPPDPYVVAPR